MPSSTEVRDLLEQSVGDIEVQLKVSVLIPYRYEGPERHAAFLWILARYAALWPEYEICVGTNDEIPMSRSKARNDAFKQATGDIFIVNDADTFCSQQSLDLAVDMVAFGDWWVLPFDVYYNLDQEYTQTVLSKDVSLENLPSQEVEYIFRIDKERHPPDGSVAGVLVMKREAYETVKGYDEGFRGWGYEDDAMAYKLDRLWSKHARIDGDCWHLWHPPAPDGDFKNPHIEHNYQRLQQIIREQ